MNNTVHTLEQEAEMSCVVCEPIVEGDNKQPQILEFVPQEAEALCMDNLTIHGGGGRGDAASSTGGGQQKQSSVSSSRLRTTGMEPVKRTLLVHTH
jgi:hypothetical protein